MPANETITAHLAHILGRESSDVASLISALASAMTDSLTEGESVAIPGFGTFSASKEDERIVPDLSTGGRVLLPPCITATFQPSSLLRRKIKNQL